MESRPLPLPLPKTIPIANFKNAGEGYLVISPDGSVRAVPDRNTAAGLQVSTSPSPNSNLYINPRVWKQTFINALITAGGNDLDLVQQALIQANLANYLWDDGVLLHSQEVKLIINAAKECWTMRQAGNRKAEGLTDGPNSTQLVTSNQNPNPADYARLVTRPEKSFGTKSADSTGSITTFKRTFPHLANFESLGNCSCIGEVGQFLEQVWQQGPRASTTMPLLYHTDRKYLTHAIGVIKAINHIQTLFTLMAIAPAGWNGIIQALDIQINILSEHVKLLAEYSPATQKEIAFHQCLSNELLHQIDLLTKKKVSTESLRDSDPFSEQRVAHSTFIWAKVVLLLFNDAQQYCSDTLSKRRLINSFTVHRSSIEKFVERKKELALVKSVTRTEFPKELPGFIAQDDHPVNVAKKECLEFLYEKLRKIGLSQEEIMTLFIKEKILLDALRRTLNSQHPPTEKQTIVASINGVTDYFTIETIYVEGWVSSAETKADGIPRNCKIHRLTDSQGRPLIIAIGHGVNDMWGIEDKEKRAASNTKAANKVVCLAGESNPRVVQMCSQGIKPKITHVSTLLVTPTGLTQSPGIKKKTVNYHEKDYKTAHLAAFQTVDDRGTVLVNGHEVEVEVITFSFGINKLATGEYNSKVTGGWSNVKKHNYRSMERFIGELNKNQLHVPEHRPAGFIGHVIDLVENSDLPAEQKRSHIDKLQQHTHIVRDLFLSGDYKKSDGDPAKMPREIIVLQAYAEQALSAINSPEAATNSKGCKSDKDRGGVVISEVLHELIIEDLGGSVLPYEKLDDEKKAIYLAVAAMQFANQTASTALPGYKAGGRDIGKDGQVYLAGLGVLAKE